MTQTRAARPTVRFIDEYCDSYKSLFSEVRSFEAFKQLHVGIISGIKRKTLPGIAKVVGLENSQSLHHFVTTSPWLAKELRDRRLELILRALDGREILVIIDEIGDRKKGRKTDYVSRQYIGNLGKVEQGIVAVIIHKFHGRLGRTSLCYIRILAFSGFSSLSSTQSDRRAMKWRKGVNSNFQIYEIPPRRKDAN